MFATGCLCHLSHMEWASRGPHLVSLLMPSWESRPSGTWMTPWMYEAHSHIYIHSMLHPHIFLWDFKHTDMITHHIVLVNSSTGHDFMILFQYIHSSCKKKHTQACAVLILWVIRLKFYPQIPWKHQKLWPYLTSIAFVATDDRAYQLATEPLVVQKLYYSVV